MNKEFIIKVFTVMTIVIVSLLLIAGGIIYISAKTEELKSMSLGLMVGSLVGGFIGIKYKIKKRYADKDERTLVIGLLSNLISQTVFALASFICFVLTAMGVIVFEQTSFNGKFLLFIMSILLLTILIEKVTNKIISLKM